MCIVTIHFDLFKNAFADIFQTFIQHTYQVSQWLDQQAWRYSHISTKPCPFSSSLLNSSQNLDQIRTFYILFVYLGVLWISTKCGVDRRKFQKTLGGNMGFQKVVEHLISWTWVGRNKVRTAYFVNQVSLQSDLSCRSYGLAKFDIFGHLAKWGNICDSVNFHTYIYHCALFHVSTIYHLLETTF